MRRITKALGILAAGGALFAGWRYIAKPAADPTSHTAPAEPGKPRFLSREEILPKGPLFVSDVVEGRLRYDLPNVGEYEDKERVLTVWGTDPRTGTHYQVELDFPMSRSDFYRGSENLATSRTHQRTFEIRWESDHFRPRGSAAPSYSINIMGAYTKNGEQVYVLRVIEPGFVKIVEGKKAVNSEEYPSIKAKMPK